MPITPGERLARVLDGSQPPGPHMLVLTKTGELFRREATARKDATAGLAWLAASGRAG